MESAKPSELLFLKKPPSLKLLIHLPRLIICICGDIHRKSLPDILLDLVPIVARRERQMSPSLHFLQTLTFPP